MAPVEPLRDCRVIGVGHTTFLFSSSFSFLRNYSCPLPTHTFALIPTLMKVFCCFPFSQFGRGDSQTLDLGAGCLIRVPKFSLALLPLPF